MKTKTFIKLAAIGLACLLVSCAQPTVQISVAAKADSSLSDRIFRDVNSYRVSKGKSALKRHGGLDAIAQKHCDYLAKNIGDGGPVRSSINHDGFEGRALAARHAYRINAFGENVAISTDHSFSLSRHFVELWKSSESHHYNMLSGWTYTGVGTAVTHSGLVITTQDFGTAVDSSHMNMIGRFERH